MNPLETRTVEAFLRAIAELEKPLSPDLQQDIRKLGHALENHEPERIQEIPLLVERDHDLKQHYDTAYRRLQKQYQVQERAKSLAILTNGSVALDLEGQIAQVLNTDDITAAVQRFVTRLDTQLASHSKQADFWERGDRILALTAGGAALGGTLGQIPGAVIGGILAAVFAWVTNPANPRQKGSLQ